MMAIYGRVVRRSAALTSVVAVVCVAVCTALGGAKGLYGSLIGIAIVTAFFGISVLVVGRAARISPHVMMAAAMISYVVKIIAFAIVVILLGKSTAFNGRMLGFTALACILAWAAAEVVTTIRLKVLYVDPDGEQTGIRRT
jgi:ATP synthase protein I